MLLNNIMKVENCVCICVCVYKYTHTHTHTHTQSVIQKDGLNFVHL